jgi:hypothetical protein
MYLLGPQAAFPLGLEELQPLFSDSPAQARAAPLAALNVLEAPNQANPPLQLIRVAAHALFTPLAAAMASFARVAAAASVSAPATAPCCLRRQRRRPCRRGVPDQNRPQQRL